MYLLYVLHLTGVITVFFFVSGSNDSPPSFLRLAISVWGAMSEVLYAETLVQQTLMSETRKAPYMVRRVDGGVVVEIHKLIITEFGLSIGVGMIKSILITEIWD